MKLISIVALILTLSSRTFADNRDTVRVQPHDLNLNRAQTGNMNYLMYSKKGKLDIPVRPTLISFNISRSDYEGKPALIVRQQWNSDTTTHKCFTVFDPATFRTLFHETYWKRLGYTMKFDFRTKAVSFVPTSAAIIIPDSVKATAKQDFIGSLSTFNLNWHADLIIYTLLKYQAGRTFIINYYDPGFGKNEQVSYTVTGSDVLTGSGGQKIDCWILNHFNDDHSDNGGYERFWISKSTNEVLKMEDFGGNGRGYRYKVKLGVSAE